ncbi:MAG TPA: hypothetical protein VIG47_10370 [Gemmatimonadaceae bacterium]
METLAPPIPVLPELSAPSCEQAVPGNAASDEEDGKLESGGGAPQPLQGGGDPASDDESGAEGDGT